MDSGENETRPVRPRRRRWWLPFVAAGIAVAALVVWRGPSSALRATVRAIDPSLRLELSGISRREGGVSLGRVAVYLRGRKEPVFRAREVVLTPGRDWLKGRFGSLTLIEPVLSLDKRALQHFGRGGGGGIPWEIGQVVIKGGHLWLEEFGEPALDVSAGIEGTLQRVGTSALAQEHTLDLSGIYVAVHHDGVALPLFGAGQAKATVSIEALTARRLGALRVDQGWLLAGAGLEALVAGQDQGGGEGGAFVLGSLDLVGLRISSGEMAGPLPQVSFTVDTALRDVGLGAAAGELAEQIHQVEFRDIDILSPHDPLKRAVSVRTVFVKFSLAGLARREIDELILLGPTVYVGETLFDYMERAGQEGKPQPEPVAVTEGWRARRLDVNFGRLIIAVGGRSEVGLPLTFRTQGENVSLSSLAGLNLNLVLNIPPDDYDFPAYELAFKNVRGELRFNYPPDKRQNNLVNVVKMDRGRWRNFEGRKLWVSVTFDDEGINGIFGGEAYRGYINGGFSFFLQPDAPWTGWVNGTRIDLAGLTQDGAPQHFTMSGRADMRLEVNGRATAIERVVGGATALGAGRLSINKLDDLLAAIPQQWAAVKRDVTRLGLEALRDFDYTKAGSSFWFTGQRGRLDLKMKGPAGSRNLDVVLHGEGGGDGAWSRRGE